MITLCDKNLCTGCGACVNICPVKCIEMRSDSRGFYFPTIQKDKCLHCEKCGKVCPILNPVTLKRPKQIFAACALNIEDRVHSASGGLASIFYERMLEVGGIGYGVYLNDEKYAVYKRIEESGHIDMCRGSKYTGSLMNDVYHEVLEDLKRGTKVIFIGMSCQIAGIQNFVDEKYKNNLLLVDILCHGMPSHQYFKEYIDYLESKEKESVTSISFRDNNDFRLKCQFEKKIYECKARYDNYFAGYTSMLFYRDSCYTCPYARVERNSDITIADFWGCDKNSNLAPVEKGVSMVLVNTDKGTEFFESVKESISFIPETIENVIRVNSQLQEPSPLHSYRKKFMEIYEKDGFMKASRKVISKIIIKNRIKWGKYFIKNNIKNVVRQIKIFRWKVKVFFGRKNIGKYVRVYFRNNFEKRKLVNTDFTIFSNTCIGGIISHDMGLEFKSPTINLYIRPKDFVKLLYNLEYYLSLELVEIDHPAPYPVAKLGDIILYLKHYKTFEEAKKKWEERCTRINWENFFVMMTDRDFTPPEKERNACSRDVLEAFDKLPYKKVCFTGEQYDNLKSCKTVEKNKDDECVNIITDIVSYSGKRLYQYAKDFDYISWLNS